MVVRFKSGSQVLTQLGLPQQDPVDHYSFPAEIDANAGTNTGIAIASPTFGSSTAKAQSFVISLLAPDGSLQDFTTLSLPVGGHASMFLNDPRLFPNLTSFAGTVSVSASAGRPFGLLALRLENAALGSVAINEGPVLLPAQLPGTPTPEIEPNDSRSQSQAITLPALISGTISSDSGQDYFSFSGKQGDVVTAMAETEGMSSDLDTILTLQNVSGATVTSNDQNWLFLQNDSFFQTVLPADGTYYVRVTSWTNKGGANFVYRLHVVNHSSQPEPQGPAIQSISPSEGSPGSSFTLTINGSNLAGASAVTFSPSSGITVSNIQSSATQVTASISIASGAATGARQVSVTASGGTSNAVTFTVGQNQGPPTIQSISPTQGSPGSSLTLTITGSNLAGATAVSFSPSTGITVSNIQSSATQVTASVSIASGAATGARQVSVTTPAGTSNSATFTIGSQAPTITSISPTSSTQGSSFTLTINGTTLTGATAVNFSSSTGISVSNVHVVSSTQVTASISIASGAATGTRNVSVTTPAGTSNTRTFTVNQSSGGSYDGTWTGTTGQGKTFSFTISGNALTRVDYAGSLSGGGCSMDFSGWTTTNIPLGGTIIDFTISNSAPYGVSLDVDGSFASTSQASGNVKLTVNPPPPGQGGCSGWVQTTWSATKQ